MTPKILQSYLDYAAALNPKPNNYIQANSKLELAADSETALIQQKLKELALIKINQLLKLACS